MFIAHVCQLFTIMILVIGWTYLYFAVSVAAWAVPEIWFVLHMCENVAQAVKWLRSSKGKKKPSDRL